MALPFVGANGLVYSGSGSNMLAPPAGYQAGDLLLLYEYWDQSTFPGDLPGWTTLGRDTATNPRDRLSWRTAIGDASDQISVAGAGVEQIEASIAVYRGIGTPIASTGDMAEFFGDDPGSRSLPPLATPLIAAFGASFGGVARAPSAGAGFIQDAQVNMGSMGVLWERIAAAEGNITPVAEGNAILWGCALTLKPPGSGLTMFM